MIDSKFIISKEQMTNIIKEYYECEKVQIIMGKKKDYDYEGDFCGYVYIATAILTSTKVIGNTDIEIKSEVELRNSKLREILEDIIDSNYEIVSIHVGLTNFTIYTHEKEMVLRRKR